MPGASSGTLVFGKESSFKGSLSPADTAYHFGRNPTVDTLSLDRQLQRMVEAGVIESVEAVAGNLEGAIDVTAVVNGGVHGDVEDIVFNSGPGTGFTSGQANSATVYVGSEYLDSGSTTDKIRELSGVIPTSYEVSYSQGGMVEFSLTMLYADESDGSVPSTVNSPTGGQDATFHSFQLDIDSTHISKLQSATLSFDNLYKFQRGDQQSPIAATLARPELSLSVTGIWDDPSNQLEYAYGDSGDTSPQQTMTGQSATVDIDYASTDITQYGLSGCKPTTYGWQDVISGESDTTETVEWLVANGSSGINVT
jgi:hypothetical protein